MKAAGGQTKSPAMPGFLLEVFDADPVSSGITYSLDTGRLMGGPFSRFDQFLINPFLISDHVFLDCILFVLVSLAPVLIGYFLFQI